MVFAFGIPSETFVVDHVVALQRAGWNVTVVCERSYPEWLARVTADTGATFHIHHLHSARSSARSFVGATVRAVAAAFYAPRLLRTRAGLDVVARAALLRGALGRIKPALVHAHFADNGMAAALAVRHAVPVIADFHGWDFNTLPSRIGWRSIAQALRHASLVVHSDFAERRVGAHLSAPIHRVRLGVDPGVFSAPLRSPSWPRRLRCLAVGRLEDVKGHDTAIRAVALARTRAKPLDLELVIIGGGPRRNALEALAREAGVDEHVRFTGPLHHADVAREMQRADILVVPSTTTEDGSEEAFGRVAIEGLAAGLPVIVSAIGGLPETIGDAGWTVDQRDPEGLAECIVRVVANTTPEECSRRATARAAEFSIERMRLEYATVAADVVERAAARAVPS